MFLDLKDIERHGASFDETPSFGSVTGPDGADCALSGARFRGGAAPGERGIELRARLSAAVELRCARCLEPVPFRIDEDVFLVLVDRVSDAPAGEVEISAEDADEYAAAEGKVDLDEVVREQIDLLLPVRAVCSEECRGLCPECGGNRNVSPCACRTEELDPRLAPLLRWKRTDGTNANG